jgi:hypothetical protein
MGDYSNMYGRHQDGEPGPSGRTTVRQDFSTISLKNLSCLRAASERDDTVVRTVARPLQVISI